MLIKRTRGWEIPERDVTPESVHSRRHVLAAAAGFAAASFAPDTRAQAEDPSAGLYPAMRNMRYRGEREITDEKFGSNYNNFYEFGFSKSVAGAAKALKVRPWQVRIEGLVESPRTVAIDDVLKAMSLEERIYRLRCVEGWSMVLPWTGFPLSAFVDWCRPAPGAKYIHMETFMDPEMAPGQRTRAYPWPYVEALTIEEARNELAFLATGIYGKPAPGQHGAPLRLVAPWKYGFKSGKSLVKFVFTDKRPKTFWETMAVSEYGFWANVNPRVPHPRWSQSTEEVIGKGGQRIPTQLFNGYGDYVAGLYTDLQNERLWA